MDLKWTSKAESDLVRLYDFLEPSNRHAAVQTVRSLAAAPEQLREFPRLGEKLEEFEPREVRRIFVGNFELRYEIRQRTVYVLRLWHTREARYTEVPYETCTSLRHTRCALWCFLGCNGFILCTCVPM